MTLRIYDKHPHADAYALNGGTVYTPYAIVAVEKRFTDAELAAEYWLSSSRKERMLGYGDAIGSATQEQAHKEWDRMEVIARFASLPHFDE